ncbi:hypothetical protein [Thermomonospora cellulosilytica]|uniref:Uncharacterized protein n=1 Tax=Thermomonospora cellulosilytica TaxID=1411118 RepID=A0A7W3N1J9_9ACTN|nr:hypothetical protein [Thermomonospora cellulosilytica]MBA9005875.1 hypothetical protein [Thermomonospora cellulosilytica]
MDLAELAANISDLFREPLTAGERKMIDEAIYFADSARFEHTNECEDPEGCPVCETAEEAIEVLSAIYDDAPVADEQPAA